MIESQMEENKKEQEKLKKQCQSLKEGILSLIHPKSIGLFCLIIALMEGRFW